MSVASRTEAQSRGRAKRAAEAWSRLSPQRSLRRGVLFMTVVAVAPLVLFASGMALMRAKDTDQVLTAAAWAGVAAVPVVIGIAAIIIVNVAVEAMVMHWLTYFERLARAYARGRYSLRPKRLMEAPLEFRALGEAVEEMAASVEHRDQALREALDDQTVLLREVHHRVKNNLQIVGSLLSLQASRSDDPAVRDALQDALVRIDAMALSQKFMQQKEEIEERISAVELFDAFANQIRARLGGRGRSLSLSTDIESGDLPLETGSRLVLVAAEALICAFRSTDQDPLACRLSLGFTPEGLRLTLTCPEVGDGFVDCPDRVSRDLIDGYVRQLRGRLDYPSGGGSLSIVVPPSAPQPQPIPAAAEAPDSPASQTAQGLKFFRLFDRTRG
jgi:signal transduction histidine kinase